MSYEPEQEELIEAIAYERGREDALMEVLEKLGDELDEVSESGGYEGQGIADAMAVVQELLDERAK